MAQPAKIFSPALRSLSTGLLIAVLTSQSPDDSFAQNICDNPVVLTGPIDTLAIVPDVVVRADTVIGESNSAVCVTVAQEGHYRIYATIAQSLGQFNESYFLTICDDGGSNCTPACDPNAGPYKIILDDTLASSGLVKSNAGIYFLKAGQNTIWMNHLSLVDHLFPELVRGDSISSAESVHLKELIIEEVNDTFDLGLTQTTSQGSVRPDSTYAYNLTLVNNGSATIHNIDLTNTLPEFVTLEQFILNAPDRITADSLFWHFDSIQSAQAVDIEFSVRFSQTPPSTPFDLVNRSRLTANCDTTLSNNFAATTVIGLPPIQYDLSLTKSVNKDSAQVGESFSYALKIINNGPDPADDIILTDVLPGFIATRDFTQQPNAANQDTLFWRFDSLAVGDSIEISFDATVEETVPSLPFQLTNTARVTAPQEVNAANSSAAVSLMAVPMRYDLLLTKSANIDSVQIGGGFFYSLKIVNLGPDPATGIVLSDILPDHVSFFDFSLQPTVATQDTLFWQFDSLAVGDSIQITLGARIEPTVPSLPFQITNTAIVTAPDESNLANSTSNAQVTIVPMRYDLEITTSANADTLRPNRDFEYSLNVINYGPDTAKDVLILDVKPQFITFSDVNPQPTSINQDTLMWRLDSLRINETFDISLAAKVDDLALTNPREIINAVSVAAVDDFNAANNSSAASVTVLPPNDCVFLDRNVFTPGSASPLQVIFQLSTSRNARLDLYDATGYHLATLAEQTFNAGSSTYLWDGTISNGKKAGSGVYIITLRSGALVCWVKVIVVQ